MSTRIFIDQENDEASSAQPAKDVVKPSSVVSKGKPVVRSHKGKVFASGSGETKRKALGNVNKQVTNQKTVQPRKGGLKVKPAAKKVSEKYHKLEKPVYPEIEKFEPYNPTDFETFDVPEEHKLSHLSMAGIGLMVNPEYIKRIETLLGLEPTPIEIPPLSLASGADYNFPNFYATFDMIQVEMPVKY